MNLPAEAAPSTKNLSPYVDLEKRLYLHLKSAVLESFSPENGSYKAITEKWGFLKTHENPESVLSKITKSVGSLFSWFSSQEEDPKVGLENVWEYIKDAYPTFPVDDFEASYMKLVANWSKYLKENPVPKHIQKSTKAELKKRLFLPVQISVERKMGKTILIVKRPVMLLGLFLKEIESRLESNLKIEEIHFVATEIIYIDCHLKQEKWHGKNVALVTKHVAVVVPSRLWDLSGNPGECLRSAKDGKRHGNINGEDGVGGKAGESGGHFTLIADSFSNMDWLTVELNGGDGGDGQDGGDGLTGRDGENGAEISIETLLADYPSPSKFNGNENGKAIRTALSNLKANIERYDTTWSSGIDLVKCLKTGVGLYTTVGCHVKGHTKDGSTIEFGYYDTQKVPFYMARHTYCLVTGGEGNTGELGGFGGYGGVGGKGGYEGQLSVYNLRGKTQGSCNLKWEAIPGDDGERGQDGLDGGNGKCGRNGIDVGYVDCDTWSDAVTYSGTLKVVTDPRDQSTAVWCPKLEKWRGIQTTMRKQPEPIVDKRVKRERPPDGKMMEAVARQLIDNERVRDEYVDEVIKGISLDGDKKELTFQGNSEKDKSGIVRELEA